MADNTTERRGQSLVEFAIALPALLFLTLMILDLGRVVYYSSAIHNAAREGARWGIVHMDAPTWQNMKGVAEDYAIGVGLQNANITYAGWGIDEPNGTHTVRVEITYSFTPATPLVSAFLDGGVVTLTGEAVMRTEYDKP